MYREDATLEAGSPPLQASGFHSDKDHSERQMTIMPKGTPLMC
jgi:hypothetical protein